jgi:hypothetical protein
LLNSPFLSFRAIVREPIHQPSFSVGLLV